MRTLFLIAVIAAFAALSACGTDAPVAEDRQAYMFAIEPCMGYDPNHVWVAPYVIIGPINANGDVAKIVATYDTQQSNRAYTLTAQILSPPTYAENNTLCWDRFPPQVSESWVTGPFLPPGQSGYYVGTYLLALQDDLFGPQGQINNAPYNPSPSVIYHARLWENGGWVPHGWTLNATDVYHWVQNY